MHPLPPHLQERLNALAVSLQSREAALGLLGLGSIGRETERADAHSDLDFFVIVRPGAKVEFLTTLDWLQAAHPLAWHFANTVDGHKALMRDGLLCEFAVFEPDELARIPYSPGRWIWRRPGIDHPALSDAAAISALPLPELRPDDWLIGEALSNLLVGLMRHQRGEHVAAMRMVQVYAVDRVMEWIDRHEPAVVGHATDAFNADRRFELRHPDRVADLARWTPGIQHTPAAALALLETLQRAAPPLPAAVVDRIRKLAGNEP